MRNSFFTKKKVCKGGGAHFPLHEPGVIHGSLGWCQLFKVDLIKEEEK